MRFFLQKWHFHYNTWARLKCQNITVCSLKTTCIRCWWFRRCRGGLVPGCEEVDVAEDIWALAHVHILKIASCFIMLYHSSFLRWKWKHYYTLASCNPFFKSRKRPDLDLVEMKGCFFTMVPSVLPTPCAYTPVPNNTDATNTTSEKSKRDDLLPYHSSLGPIHTASIVISTKQ